ncbi:hypothetical protein P8C59_005769 [Phyllachora maydis]|uniref:Uncharacterized protein n=1 Tax=Phyllachora maydis TaxID=1825666 RepID=A0AAD9MDU8_9PEZI|nr:hypothetical protein P8C59_005769 [Phyllachora maydis]
MHVSDGPIATSESRMLAPVEHNKTSLTLANDPNGVKMSFLLRTNQLAKNAVSPLKVTVAFAAQLAAALTAVFVASCAMVAHNMVARL